MQKKSVKNFGMVGLLLDLICFISAYLMAFIRCASPLSSIVITIVLGVLGAIFCVIQIVKNSSEVWSVLSIVGVIFAIIGIYGSIVLMGHPC